MGFFARTPILGLILGAASLTTTATPATAQYFGRNKVQYEDFDFKVLRTEHFNIHYYPEVEVEYAALMAERWYSRLSRLLDHELSGRQTLILYASHPHFRQTNALSGTMDEGTQGVTELLKRRIVLPYLGPLAETDHVIGHELVHAFQFDITGEGGGILRAGVPGVARMPLWFTEGMAEYLSVGHIDAETAMWMRALVQEDRSAIGRTDNRAMHPYQHGQALWAFIAGRWGDDVVGRLLKAARSVPSAQLAFQRVLRVRPDSLLAQWEEAMRDASEPLIDQTEEPSAYGRPILGKASGGGNYNISPSISPDGQDIVFLSEKDLFAIEMFLSDAKTGEVKRKIVKTAVDPHFEGLQFVNSAGSWDFSHHAGRRFAFAAVRKGQPALSILNTETGDVVYEKIFKELGEIFNPAWAPDGRQIVFSAITGGLSDLYAYDIETEELRRLTNDAFGDFHPVWSPDGRTIVFGTERFTSGLTSLMHGHYTLGMLDVATGAITEVEAFPRGKHINPQFSPDGKSLYFISDQNGISNVYRKDLESGEIFQITNVYTGVAGIAPLSPAMSVAAETGVMTVSVFRGSAIEIFRIEDPDILHGGPVIESFRDVDPAVLPPATRMTRDVIALLDNPFFGLPQSTDDYTTDDYHAGLGLDYVAQPSLVVGADRFGTFIGGGTSLFWSDILGGRNLATLFQINGGVKDISAAVAYTNLSHRLNWGVQIQQFSYQSRFFSSIAFNDSAFGPVAVDQLFILRQINRELGGLISYPFSRVHRIELSGGVRNITFAWEARQDTFSLVSGQHIGSGTQDITSPNALNLAQASTALVYDNSYYGIASPILGQRYRLEVAPTVGSLDFVTGLVDFRKYVMPVQPITIAARLMHYGRYGGGAEDSALQPLYLGYPNLVRGYDLGSFSIEECNIDGTCPVYDQLLGSRIIVANLEVRFPPLGVLGLGDGFFGFLPLEMGIFVDGGIAWGSDDFQAKSGFGGPTPEFNEQAFFLGGDREPIFSTGASFRFNLFGYFILGLDWVKPFQRPDKGMHLQFNMSQGF